VATSLRLTLLLAAALWLTWDPYQLLWFINVRPLGQALSLLGGLLVAATLAAPWFARRGVTIALAVSTAVALGLAYYHVNEPVNPIYLAPHVIPPLALAALAAAEQVRPPRAWLWLPGSLFAASALFYLQHMVDGALASSLIGIAATVIAYGIVCATVLWLAVDVRPAIAFLIGWEWLLALAAGGLAMAIVRLRRNQPAGRSSPHS
jgi:hypothetical protein